MRLRPYFDISQSSDLSTFCRRLVAFSHEFEFALVNAMVVQDAPGHSTICAHVGNTPESFSERHSDIEIGRRDPVLQQLKRQSVPISYDQGLYVRGGAADLWEQNAMFGYKTGIAVALHLPDHLHFLLGVDRPEPLPDDVDELTDMMASLQLLAVHAQDAAIRLLAPQPEGPRAPAPSLTLREAEVLRWTMDGKSSWAVGEILAISENTVNFHVRNALRKLQSSSKHQAVLKALALGLL